MNKRLSSVSKTLIIRQCLLYSLVFSGAISTVYSQNNPWLDTYPVKLGFGMQYWTATPVIDNFRYTQVDNDPNNSDPLSISANNSFSYTRFPLVFECIGKYSYCSLSATGAIDLFTDLRGYEMIGSGDTEAKRLELIPFKLAFGKWIDDRYGLFAGFQYAYSHMVFSDHDVPDMLILGGHQRGLHGLAYINFNRLLVRSVYQYDWVSYSEGASQGNAQTIDLQFYYALGRRRVFGLWAGISYKSVFSPGPQGQPEEGWINRGIQNTGGQNTSYNLPDISGEVLYIKGGLYILLWQLKSYNWYRKVWWE